jgi:hypothetical protein
VRARRRRPVDGAELVAGVERESRRRFYLPILFRLNEEDCSAGVVLLICQASERGPSEGALGRGQRERREAPARAQLPRISNIEEMANMSAHTAVYAVWNRGTGAQWWNFGLTSDQLKSKDDGYFKNGFRLADLTTKNDSYTAVWRPGTGAQH